MKLLIPIASAALAILVSCGPAAEDREQMHANAKFLQDSLARVIREAIAEAEGPPAQQVIPADTPAPVISIQNPVNK